MCASGVRPTGWMRPGMSPSDRGPSLIARLSSRWLGCFAGSRSPRRVTGSGSKAGVPLNRKRGWLSGQGNHGALRARWSSGRLRPMDNAALPTPGLRSPSPRPRPEVIRDEQEQLPVAGSESWPAARARPPCPGMFGTGLQTAGSAFEERARLPRGGSAEPDEQNVPAARAAALRTRLLPPSGLEVSQGHHMRLARAAVVRITGDGPDQQTGRPGPAMAVWG